MSFRLVSPLIAVFIFEPFPFGFFLFLESLFSDDWFSFWKEEKKDHMSQKRKQDMVIIFHVYVYVIISSGYSFTFDDMYTVVLHQELKN